jgi:transcriptional regulator with XRE-family HTH domain
LKSHLFLHLRELLKKAQAKLGLKNYEMAAELRITPEWYGKITGGKAEPSDDLRLRLDELLRRRKIELSSISEGDDGPASSGTRQSVQLRQRIQQHVDDLLAAAGNDQQRLGWIAEQLLAHVDVPGHWDLQERIINEATAKEIGGDAAKPAQPAPRRQAQR